MAVGYASVAGLAWLGKRTTGRPVTLIIGNAQASRFQKASAADRAAAVKFLRRGDVEIKNWYRTGRRGGTARDAHLKVWAVLETDDQVTAALVGSANLTRQGLVNNEEACAEASGADLVDIERRMIALRGEAWDCRGRIIGYLKPDAPPVARNAPRRRLGPSPADVGGARQNSAPLQQPGAHRPNPDAVPLSAPQQTAARSVDGSGTSHAPRRPAGGTRPVHVPTPPPSRSRRLLTRLLAGLGMALTWLGRAAGFLLEAMVIGLVELFAEPPQRGGSRSRHRGGRYRGGRYRGGQRHGGQYRGGRSRGRQYRGSSNGRSRRRYNSW